MSTYNIQAASWENKPSDMFSQWTQIRMFTCHTSHCETKSHRNWLFCNFNPFPIRISNLLKALNLFLWAWKWFFMKISQNFVKSPLKISLISQISAKSLWHVYVHPCSLLSLCCLHEETLHPWLSKMHPAQSALTLHWAHVHKYVFWHCASYVFSWRKDKWAKKTPCLKLRFIKMLTSLLWIPTSYTFTFIKKSEKTLTLTGVRVAIRLKIVLKPGHIICYHRIFTISRPCPIYVWPVKKQTNLCSKPVWIVISLSAIFICIHVNFIKLTQTISVRLHQ